MSRRGLAVLGGVVGAAVWGLAVVLTRRPRCAFCDQPAMTFRVDGGPGRVCREHHWDQPVEGQLTLPRQAR